jgi:hypothetical protein
MNRAVTTDHDQTLNTFKRIGIRNLKGVLRMRSLYDLELDISRMKYRLNLLENCQSFFFATVWVDD